ncbi:hypothetical protein SLEP1_g34238 [Rubroshorea leprosula]|uniref:Integrase catalytic domain-containing protein n=1 Tax=Rubroshorea leprosula TaxID=152421 RepID=A0AAV5KJ73_9ROSI|nr:hypothetical protein SLEP1_g34238 [Rubroshorea leprosula]
MDEQEDTQLSEPDDDERTPTGYATQPEQFQIPIGTRHRHPRQGDAQRERPERSAEPARTTELEERTRVLEMAMGKILARLIPDDPLIPLLNRDAQPTTVVATRNSPALSNVVVPTRPRGSGRLNPEPSSSKHNEELLKKNADLERQLKDVQKSIDELKSPRSHQQTLDLDSAPLNLSIIAEPYQEEFKIPHLETYDGSGDPDEHLHTYQAIMRIQNANDAMMCKVFPTKLKSTARRWYHKLPRHSIDSYSQLAKLFSNKFASQREIKCTVTELMQVHQKEGESLRDYMQRFNKATLDIDNVPDTICLSALLHGLKRGRFLDDLLENPPKTWNKVNHRSASFILSEDFQSSKRRADDKQNKGQEQPPRREEKKKQKVNEQWEKPADFPKYANYIPLTLPRSQILAQIQHWIRRPLPPLHDSPRADKSKHCDYHRVYGHNTEDCQHLKDELEFLARNGKLEGYVQKPHTQQPVQTHFVQGYDRPQGQRYQLGNTQDIYHDNQYPSKQGRANRGRQFNRRGQGQRTATQNQKDRKGVGYAGIPPPSGTINMISGGIHSGGQSARGRKAYARQVMTVNKNRPLKRPFEEAEWENASIIFSPTDYKRADREPDVMMPHADPFVATVHIGNHNVNKVFIDTGSSPDILYWSCFQKMQLNPSSLQKHEGPIYGFDNQPVRLKEMESAFNAILGRATLCELKAVISQPHLCMKFPTPQGVGVLKENQKMARACYQDTFKKVELAAAPVSSENHRPAQLGQQTMSISDIKHRPEGVEQKAEPVEPVETVPLNPDVPERTAGFIRRVEYSEWVSNPVLVKKPNGKWRMCIDFTNLNEACPKDPHPLPNVEKLVERGTGHERMSFLDTISGYHQKLVQIIFKLQICKNIEVYVDDMTVTSVRAEDHIDNLSETFQNLRQAQMKLNPLKCTFAVESGKFLRYVVSKKGIEVNPEKVQAVQQMEPPKTVKDVQRLTVRVAALHRFIARSAERCLPFFKALREPKNFQWTDKCQRAFDKLKQYLASAPLLSKPVERESLYLYLRVIEEAVSSVLLREENKNQKPIYYVSKVLQGAEQNYPLAEKAVFALVYTARKLRAYFQSNQIIVYINLPLRKILQKPELSGRLIGWSVELSEYDLKFQPRTTIKGQAVADFLVECILATVEEKAPEHPVWVLYVDGAANIDGSGAGAVLLKVQSIHVFSDSQLVVSQMNGSCEIRNPQLGRYASVDLNPQRSTIVEVLDAPSYTNFTVECQLLSTDPSSPSWTTPLINYLQSGELPEDSSVAKLVRRRAAHFTLVDNQLYKRAASMPLLRCLTPYEVEYAVREVHEGVCGTHIGGKTLARKLLRHGYYWPTMVEDAQIYVKKCPTCQFNADDIHMPGEMLSSLSSPWPFAQWGVDLLGPFMKGKGGCTYLVVVVDYFTKWIEAKPLSMTTEKKIEEFLFNSILCRFGIPKRIITDNGQQLRATALRSFCLKTRVLATHSNWVDELNKVLWSCRTTPNSTTSKTPFSLAYGAEAVIPVEVGLPSDRSGHLTDQVAMTILIMSNF